VSARVCTRDKTALFAPLSRGMCNFALHWQSGLMRPNRTRKAVHQATLRNPSSHMPPPKKPKRTEPIHIQQTHLISKSALLRECFQGPDGEKTDSGGGQQGRRGQQNAQRVVSCAS